ncbi:hypothetical protein [Streptomyces sp. NPDC056105]|uniref:hypothetical protein n=1 Tax=Streptomyces sp. NPDC056105 TaxID=3345714 RepID=UPI0035DE8AE1
MDRPAALGDRGRGCVLVLPRLIRRDGKGAAGPFDAASGRSGWTSRGFTAGPDDLQGVQELPTESDGTRVFVPGELGVTGVDAATAPSAGVTACPGTPACSPWRTRRVSSAPPSSP